MGITRLPGRDWGPNSHVKCGNVTVEVQSVDIGPDEARRTDDKPRNSCFIPQNESTVSANPREGDASETDRRRVVGDAMRSLTDNSQRMQNDKHRRPGLPIATSAVQSTITQINQIIKSIRFDSTETKTRSCITAPTI